MKRAEILDTAKEMVTGHREQDYGTPESNFTIIARLWSAYLGWKITAEEVAVMMCLFKIGRLQAGRGTPDTYIDLAGYAACGGEIATEDTGGPNGV